MHIKHTPRWAISENEATPETVFLNRRALMKGTASLIAGGALASFTGNAFAANSMEAGVDPLPATRNQAYTIERDLTPEDVNIDYNNFYEYGSHKGIAKAARKLEPRPWEITIDGLVENEMTLDIDDLIAKIGLEERLYRHRCVEAWSMTIPWTGFALAKLVALAQPTLGAKYLEMKTFNDGDMASGIKKQKWYPWPYTEGLTLAEATNDLAFLAVGAYGKVIHKQHGAPIRLATPWKYGFKSIKSIVSFTFTDKRPISFWEELNAKEYGFWANVNPEVPHPRWSQATERVLGINGRIPTQLFNGYAPEVADLYTGMEDQDLYR